MSTSPDLQDGPDGPNSPQGPQIPAIKVVGATKSYKKGSPVLNNLNMTVPANSVYALLGSSGCGKTTTLTCCVGLKKLDAGEISIFGYPTGSVESGVPGRRVGFMPQDISLYGEMTIEEILTFYGRVYGMTKDQIDGETDFLLDFLDLPKPNRKVDTFSGGQQRRASMAVTLLHDPELLIMDEPTVGVDPLLRESIWQYIIALVAHGRTTVVVTTHYIDEAKQAHTIGIMRNGRLLEEKPPHELMDKYNTDNLDEVMVILCRKDTSEDDDKGASPVADVEEADSNYSLDEVVTPSKAENAMNNNNSTEPPKDVPKEREAIGMPVVIGEHHQKIRHRKTKRHHIGLKKEILMKVWRTYAVLSKEWVSLRRNVGFLIFTLLAPSVIVLIGLIMLGADPKNVQIAIISRDGEDCSKIHNFKSCPFGPEGQHLISCYITHFLETATSPGIPEQEPRKIFKIMNHVKKSGLREVQKRDGKVEKMFKDGELKGFFLFPKNYSRAFECRFGINAPNPLAPGCGLGFSDSDVVRRSTMKVVTNQIAVFNAYAVMKGAMNATHMLMKLIKRECGKLPEYKMQLSRLGDLVKLEKHHEGKDQKGYRAPGILFAMIFFLPLCSSSIMFITERKNGTLDRMMVAGVTASEYMAAFSITQVIMLHIQAILGFLVMHVFDVRVKGGLASGGMIIAVCLSATVGISGMTCGFVLAALCKEEVQAVLGAIALFFPNALLSGVLMPLSQAELKFFEYFSYLLPCTLASDALRLIMSRGFGLGSIRVCLGFVSSFSWIVGFWAFAIVIHHITGKS